MEQDLQHPEKEGKSVSTGGTDPRDPIFKGTYHRIMLLEELRTLHAPNSV